MSVCMYLFMKSARQRGGPINSKQKKSIFAVPDSIEGRVSLQEVSCISRARVSYMYNRVKGAPRFQTKFFSK